MVEKINMTEAELIKACLANNSLAQKELYERYKKAMYTLAYRVTGDFESANDVLQDAFLKVFRNLASFRGESTIGAWIKTIVIRTAYSKLRKNKIYFEDLDKVNANQHVDWGDYLAAEYLEKAINALPNKAIVVRLINRIEII